MLLGRNGQGKTNLLEAISFLSLTRSFYAATDATAVRLGSEFFEISGTITTDSGVAHDVRVVYDTPTTRKHVTINGSRPETLSSVIGRFPVVVLSPENGGITSGPPAERRTFIDLVLAQLSRSYLEDLLEYRRVLKQRNKILLDAKLSGGAPPRASLEPWTISLVSHGSNIVQRRLRFVDEFQGFVLDAYRDLVAGDEEPGLRYDTLREIARDSSLEDITRVLTKEAAARAVDEIRRGTTLVGPHRDDLVLFINGIGVHEYASQGQHKTMLVALKVAEFFYLMNRRGESPILLLDDLFSELDQQRSGRIVDMLGQLKQTIVTTTDATMFGSPTGSGGNKRFIVEQGTCHEA
jgi:DNA replication and repair protein RecF